jgi:hypothetical protein
MVPPPARAFGRPDARRVNFKASDRLEAMQRQLLALHPDAEAVMLVHGFKGELLADLVGAGLATVDPHDVASGRAVEMTWFRITDKGRRAL